ncbi:hypothetical protein [Limosilactobacillus agrestimuris]|uniref:hypothetical protein n=1 Tax=Limosilactobacillus agrestimuris TaxID=2941331 RepID=UPI00203B72B9|nr:hypothetical protein [Limosilactobacillus agrestimuris]
MSAFLAGLSVALIVAKMLGFIHISWLLAFTPMLIYLVIEVVAFLVVLFWYITGLYRK